MIKLFTVYAHRGASEYAPENTLMSFYLGMLQGANGIETDVQITKDNQLVLFHDDTLERVTGAPGKVKDYTYEQLQKLDVINPKVPDVADRIPLFEDFLRLFSFRNITFAIEIKCPGIEKQVIEMMDAYQMRSKAYITSFQYDIIRTCKLIEPSYPVGWLIKEHLSDTAEKLKAIRAEQICPRASFVTREYVQSMHAEGFSVRAWGVANEQLMTTCYDAGVDGMTVNFPDRLLAYIYNTK